MEDAWHYKKTLAMMNSERILLEDSSSVNYWFPSHDNRYGDSTFVRRIFTERGEKVSKKGGYGQQGLRLYCA